MITEVLFTGKPHTTGGRDGAALSSDSKLNVSLSLPDSNGLDANPEQLFAAGWPACFIGAMGLAALIGAAFTFIPLDAQAQSLSTDAKSPLVLAQAAVTAALAGTKASDASIRPFQFHATDEALADLHRRILATKWPDRELVNDATQGVRLETMQELAQYWAAAYDWRKAEAKLNALPQFVTNIDGVDIHDGAS